MNYLQFINNVVLVIIEGVILLLFFTFLIDRKDFIKQNKVKSALFSFLYVIVINGIRSFIPVGLHVFFIAGFVAIAFSHITSIKLYISLLIQLIFIIFGSIIEIPVLLGDIAMFKVSIDEILENPTYKLFHMVVYRFIELILIVILYRSKIRTFKSNIFRKEYSPFAFLLFQVAALGIFVVSFSYVTSNGINTPIYIVFLLVLYLTIIILSFFDFKERERILKVQSKFQAQEEHVRHLETVIDFIRREKHDFANHLNTIHIMGKLDKPDSLAKIVNYTTKLTQGLSTSYQFYNTGNDYIDGLLAVKSNVAHEKAITVKADFEAPLSWIDIPDSDLTSIVGNIVDNAFEAVSGKAGAQSKVMSISSYVERDKYYLSIANNGPMIPEKTLEKIFESGFSTKTDNKADHGYGLYIVKQMVERNGGEISVSSSEDETVFILDFGVKDSKRLEVV